MTKRPLLCGVLVFTIGEIVGMSQYMAMGLGMVIGGLLIWKIISMRNPKVTMPFIYVCMSLFFMLGILNGIRIRIPDEFQTYVEEYTRSDTLQCELTGTVLRIEQQKERMVILVRTDSVYTSEFITTNAYNVRLYIQNEDTEAEEGFLQSEGKETAEEGFLQNEGKETAEEGFLQNEGKGTEEEGFLQNEKAGAEEKGILQIGSQIHCTLQLTVPTKPTNPGEFDSATYYHAKGISFLGYVNSWECMDSGQALIRQWVMERQTEAQQVFERALPQEQAGIMEAMLLGLTGDLDSDIKALYQRNGIAHILAISALHISIIGGALYKLLRKLGLSYAFAGVPVMIVLLLYGWMTGFSGSTIRAVMMFSIFLLGDIIGRTYDMLTAAGMACLFMLIEQPIRIQDAGFLLSFSAVLTLGFVVPKVQELIEWDSKWKQGILSGILIQMVTAPIIIHFYYDFPIYAFLLNLIVIPLMTPLLVCGIAGVLLYPLVPAISVLVLQPCGWILFLYQWLCEHMEKLPCSILHVGAMSVWKIAVYYAFLLGIFLFFKHKKRNLVVLCIILYACFCVLTIPQRLQISMLDIGQGDAILLRTPNGKIILVDGGSSTRSSIGRYVITPAVKYYGANQIDYVFVSHMDSDHVNGIEELIALSLEGGIQINCLILPEIAEKDESFTALIQQAESAGVCVQMTHQGDVVRIGEVDLECLYPGTEAEFSGDENNNSMVLSLQYGEFDMLFTGDLETEGEKILLEQQKIRDYDVLKVGHHGSSGASSQAFLEQVKPELALISCGSRNRYGHPHAETLERLQEQGAFVYCTKDSGAIVLTTDGKRIKVKKYY